MSLLTLFVRAVRGDAHLRHVLARRLVRRLDPNNFLGESGKIWLEEASLVFGRLGISRSELEVRAERLFVLREVVRQTDGLPGDLIEFGVHAGTSAAVMLDASTAGTLWGLDSFQGLSKPSPELDGSRWSEGELAASIEQAWARLEKWGDRVSLVKGWIPDCLGSLPAGNLFRFAHIDVDLFEPTLHSLEYVGGRIVAGGMIVCDDFGFSTCPGATTAVLKFMEGHPEYRMLHIPTGQAVLSRC